MKKSPKKFLAFQNVVNNIQTTGYNGAPTVHGDQKINGDDSAHIHEPLKYPRIMFTLEL